MKTSRIAGALASAGALAVFVAAPAEARVKHVWVAAVPNSWNVAPSGYEPPLARSGDGEVRVLTPPSIVRAIEP